MVYCGVLSGPRRRLENRGRCRFHRQAPLGGRAASGWRFQHRPGRTGGTGAGRGDHRGPVVGRYGGHDRPLTPTAQAMVEGWTHMGNSLGWPGGSLPDRLHPGHRQSSIPERSGPVCATQHIPLLGLGVTPWN